MERNLSDLKKLKQELDETTEQMVKARSDLERKLQDDGDAEFRFGTPTTLEILLITYYVTVGYPVPDWLEEKHNVEGIRMMVKQSDGGLQ